MALKIIACNSNPELSLAISKNLGVKPVATEIRRFTDGEIFVEIGENIRGDDVFIVQSTSNPANDNLMELLICIDAVRRASAKQIIAVMPYFGYARQDRKSAPRTPITAKLVANLLEKAGADRVITIDLHAGQIQGFFDIPVDNLFAAPLFLEHIKSNFINLERDIVVTSPDVGGIQRSRFIAKKINSQIAIIDKRRERAGVSEVMNVIGDVGGKTCIIVDDIVDSGGTLCNAAKALSEHGAKDVFCYITHPVLSGSAIQRINDSVISKLFVTDSIPLDVNCKSDKIHVISVAGMLASVIQRVDKNESISALFL